MRKAIKICAFIIGALLLAPLLVGFFLPSAYKVERSLVIHAEAAAIYPRLASLKEWDKWSAWGKGADPAAKFTYEGPESGTGAVWKWNGPKLGNGRLMLTKCVPPELVEYELSFENDSFKGHGAIRLAKEGGATRVAWVGDGDLGGNPLKKLFGRLMDKMLGDAFQTGLNNLKAGAEKQP